MTIAISVVSGNFRTSAGALVSVSTGAMCPSSCRVRRCRRRPRYSSRPKASRSLASCSSGRFVR